MLQLIIATALAAHAPTDFAALAAVKPQTVAARVRACGFPRVGVTFDDVLQEPVVTVDQSAATSEQLHCTARASLNSVYYVQFAARSLDRVYQRVYSEMSRARNHADAVAWLARRGLLSKLPAYDATRAAKPATARAIEAVCGSRTGKILDPRHNGVRTAPDPRALLRLSENEILSMSNAAEATGYRLGFIGNEAYRKD